MLFILVLSILSSLVLSYELLEASSQACFSAKDKTKSTIFSAPKSGLLEGILLKYINNPELEDGGIANGVTCNVNDANLKLTHFGCSSGYDLMTQIFKVTDSKNFAGEKIYPTSNTKDFSHYDANIGSYKIKGYDRNSDQLLLKGPMIRISTNDEFMIQYSEAMSGYAVNDNGGQSCVEVLFLYSTKYEALQASSNAQFNAADKTKSTIFSAPKSGVIVGIELEYVSGGVTCNKNDGNLKLTHFGCSSGHDLMVELYKVKHKKNYIGTQLYPKTSTHNIIGPGSVDAKAGEYKIKGYNRNSKILRIMNPIYAVSITDSFMLQFTEAYSGYAKADNAGTTTVKVIFIYSNELTSSKVSSNACFTANDKSKSTIFTEIKEEGILTGVQLEYNSGGVTCNKNDGNLRPTNFGCSTGHDLMTELYKVTDSTNKVGIKLYPQTNVIDLTSGPGNNGEYKIKGFDRNSNIIPIIGPLYSVKRGDKYMLQFSEAYSGITSSDNSGTTCASVTLIYSLKYVAYEAKYNNGRTNACFNAKDKSISDIFESQSDGLLAGIQLNVVKGVKDSKGNNAIGVTCANVAKTNFGCSSGHDIMTSLYKVTNANTKTGFQVIPNTSTKDLISGPGNHGEYKIKGYDRNSQILTVLNPKISVSTGDQFMLQFTEAYTGLTASDNDGSTCVNVIFLIQQDITPITLSNKACFNAANKKDSDIFYNADTQILAGFELEYVSGGVTCNKNDGAIGQTKYGCSSGYDLMVEIYEVTNNNERIGNQIYPNINTNGFHSKDNTVGSYKINGYNRNSNILTFMNPLMQIGEGQPLMLQYSETYRNYAIGDNLGKSCSKVTAFYYTPGALNGFASKKKKIKY